MLKNKEERQTDLDPQETAEWLEALEQIVDEAGPDRAAFLLDKLLNRAADFGVSTKQTSTTPYLNTIPAHEEVPYPGNRELERRIKSLIRWNAAAMVVRANKYDANIGGHISTYASLAGISEVCFNHVFRGSYDGAPGDLVYYQGHASPGVYSRAFLEGRLSEEHLLNFRHELRDHPGLSSYPHPWLMPDFWQFPTVSMGLGPSTPFTTLGSCATWKTAGFCPRPTARCMRFSGTVKWMSPSRPVRCTLQLVRSSTTSFS